MGTSIETSYIGPYLSLNQLNMSYFSGFSGVGNYSDNTRLAYANITEVASVSPNANGAVAIGAELTASLVAGSIALIDN